MSAGLRFRARRRPSSERPLFSAEGVPGRIGIGLANLDGSPSIHRRYAGFGRRVPSLDTESEHRPVRVQCRPEDLVHPGISERGHGRTAVHGQQAQPNDRAFCFREVEARAVRRPAFDEIRLFVERGRQGFRRPPSGRGGGIVTRVVWAQVGGMSLTP